MARFEIIGGKPLGGKMKVSGSKNQALKLIPFSILLRNEVLIKNVPRIQDIFSLLEIVADLGGEFKFSGNSLRVNCGGVKSFRTDSLFARQLRASIVLVGPLLARFKQASLPHPGGCAIGARSIDTHEDAFRQLGARVRSSCQRLEIALPAPRRRSVKLKEKSVTATENLALYAAGVKDGITISNCAIEPEVIGLFDLIKAAGGVVRRRAARVVTIEGSEDLHLDKIEVVPDRIEAATFALAFAVTGGEGVVSPFPAEHLGAFLDVLGKSGVNFHLAQEGLRIDKTTEIKPFKIKTAPYPGFPTDLQSPTVLLAAKANGPSEIYETMFENRLGYLNELKKMGLECEILSSRRAKILPGSRFKPTVIRSLDLRSGITLLIAALMTPGKTIVEKAENIDRGYESIEEKLRQVGGRIRRFGDAGRMG